MSVEPREPFCTHSLKHVSPNLQVQLDETPSLRGRLAPEALLAQVDHVLPNPKMLHALHGQLLGGRRGHASGYISPKCAVQSNR